MRLRRSHGEDIGIVGEALIKVEATVFEKEKRPAKIICWLGYCIKSVGKDKTDKDILTYLHTSLEDQRSRVTISKIERSRKRTKVTQTVNE